MRQLDVFENPSPRSRAAVPFIVVLQSDFVSDTRAVVVASLVPETRHDLPKRLYPVVEVQDRRLMVFVTDLASIPRTMLRMPIANLSADRDSIIGALDLLLSGV